MTINRTNRDKIQKALHTRGNKYEQYIHIEPTTFSKMWKWQIKITDHFISLKEQKSEV